MNRRRVRAQLLFYTGEINRAMNPLNHMMKIFCVLGFVTLFHGSASAEDEWFVSFYTGQYSNTALNEIVRFNTDFERSHVYAISLGKELGTYKDSIRYEVEGQVAWHSGKQTHGEVNAAFTLRWLPFPWDRYLDTSFAFGNGLSYAASEPELEIREGDEKETNQLLYYILVELAFTVPQYHSWDVFVRIHHRSSVFGVIDGISTGSNFVGMGLRYRFLSF
jgi:hypothetical protein